MKIPAALKWLIHRASSITSNLLRISLCLIVVVGVNSVPHALAQGNGGFCPPPPPPPPKLPPTDETDTDTADARDPNEKLGPVGFSTANYLTPGTPLPYRIKFENFGPGSVDGSGALFPSSVWATAPAQEVEITDPLSSSLDWSTFRFTGAGFGDTIIAPDQPTPSYQSILPVTINSNSFEVHFEIALDPVTGRIRAVFRSIDPETSLPPEVLTGFLPPEDGTGRGQGYIEYTIEPKTNLVTGTQIRNVALISFDKQPSIATDQIDPLNVAAGNDPGKQALVTIDAGAPTSSVAALPAESGRSFVVSWSGADDANGSGIASYDLFISTNGGPFGLWFQSTSAGGVVFQGDLEQTYAFYSVGKDNVGNVEAAPLVPDAQTMIVSNAPILATITNMTAQPGSVLSLTNMVSGTVFGSALFSLAGAPSGVTINETNGVLNWTPSCSQGNTTNVVNVWVTDSARTNISDMVSFLVAVETCVQPSLGQQVLLAGTSGKVPINLIAKAALTNLQATLVSPPGRLLNFNLEVIVTNISTTSVTPLSNAWHRLDLVTFSNQFLTGTQQVAWLHFTAADLASAFVPLSLTNLSGFESNGNAVANFAPQSGRVVVVSDEPLMECVHDTNGQPLLILYGKPQPGYGIETRTNLQDAVWQPAISNLTLTNLWLGTNPPPSGSALNFFRGLRQGPLPPPRFLEVRIVGVTNVVLRVRGLAERPFEVEAAPDLNSPSWQVIGGDWFDKDGQFRFTNGLPPGLDERYYRAVLVPEPQ